MIDKKYVEDLERSNIELRQKLDKLGEYADSYSLKEMLYFSSLYYLLNDVKAQYKELHKNKPKIERHLSIKINKMIKSLLDNLKTEAETIKEMKTHSVKNSRVKSDETTEIEKIVDFIKSIT
jgi:hypothetical protein